MDAMPVNAPAERQERFKMKYSSMRGVKILKMTKSEYVDAVRHVPVG